MITIIGGNGYVGRSLGKHAINRGFKVNSISRTGGIKDQNSSQTYWDKQIQFIKGDAMKPEQFHDILVKSDKIVHAVGILRAESNEQYDKMNRDTAVSMAKYVDKLCENDNISRKFVMISSSHHPPMMKRYLESKEEAEKIIKEQTKYMNYIIMKPGFIYSSKERWWSTPLSVPIDAAFSLFGKCNSINNVAKLQSSVSLNQLCLATLHSLESQDIKNQTLYNENIIQNASIYQQLHNVIFTV